MRGLTSVDLHFMAKELQLLIGGRIDKIYQLKEDIYIEIYVTAKGKNLLKITTDKIWITKHKPSFEELPHFAESLRKHLNGTRVKEIKQIDSERILELITEAKEKQYKLYIELFSNGNIILETDGKIKAARLEKKWKDRTIRRGQAYELPPKAEDILKITEARIKEILDEDIISKRLAKIGFGKEYAQELCERAGISNTEQKADPEKIYLAIKQLLNEEPNPQVYYENKEAILATPIKFKSKKEESKKTETFSEAIDETDEKPIKKDNIQKEKEKIQNIIKKQEEDIKKINEKANKEKRKAEIIYEKYMEFKDILEQVKNKKIPENVKIDWEKKKIKVIVEDN